MSRMKHLLRKLHIGGSVNEHHRLGGNRANSSSSPPPSTSSSTPHSSSTGSTVARNRVGDATERTTGVVSAAASAESSVDFNFFEEEFQVQLALAISASDHSSREDQESAQIKAAKRMSLGCSPVAAADETLVEFLSLHYWNYNVLNYDEKVMDGFYDVYGISSNSNLHGKMPLLVDLQATSISGNVDYEVILVNRTTDPSLQQLERRAASIALECQAIELGPILSGLVQKIADLVVDKMGGPVSDADEMLRRWTARSYELRNSLNTIILPLGCLDVGLSRHRALLFKVLADRVNLPCRLVKGSYYTGTDEGAVNLIKIDCESEYIIDLMGAPGTLIPAEIPNSHIQSSGFNVTRSMSISEGVNDSCLAPDKVNYQSENTTQASGGISSDLDHREVSSSGSVEVSGVFQLEANKVNLVEENKTKKNHDGFECRFDKLPSSVEHVLVPFIEEESLNHVAYKNKQKCSAQDMTGIQKGNADISSDLKLLIPTASLLSAKKSRCGISNHQPVIDMNVISADDRLSSLATSEGFVLIGNGNGEVIHDFIDVGSASVPRTSYGKQIQESSVPHLAKSRERQLGCVLNGAAPLSSHGNAGGIAEYVETKGNICLQENPHNEQGLVVKPMEMASSEQHSNIDCERVNTQLDEVAEWEIPWEDLQIGERIGLGSYGEVYHADWNGTEVAVKKFLDQDFSGDALQQFRCEVMIMRRLRHPNVVLFMGAVTRPPNLSILTEFLPRGSLYRLLHRSGVQLDEKRRLRMALDVAKGMNYLHTSHPTIVHRDLKSPNLLVDKNWVVKVCDFGLSRLKHNTFLSSKSTAGTPEWMAPEVLRNERSNEKCDVYSFGVILWELATLRMPWSGMNPMQVVGAVGFQNRRLDIPEEVDPAVRQIICDCWQNEPELRPSFQQLLTPLKHLQRLVVENP
ncbi:PREDICTED: serine/threonine-protein kinase EDR1-like [Nelumbo nucifera]|uniref:non-specific serine/threonine protein kinase n=2 Tax=Nelumbo nucifera TaxID=4432 RepID=A0A823A049_NELNU|nr:PREDICTED: serine/threonine-protein kinase EDR1-like [Nelumbo nucifera]DAD48975.1 TPA_asm: hypothetical protein HUJ06_018912 [Nelumbo nucifera]